MGEEGSSGGTVRYVDSSLERIEVKVTGLVDPRHRITVDGISLPLQPTGRVGEFVACAPPGPGIPPRPCIRRLACMCR